MDKLGIVCYLHSEVAADRKLMKGLETNASLDIPLEVVHGLSSLCLRYSFTCGMRQRRNTFHKVLASSRSKLP